MCPGCGGLAERVNHGVVQQGGTMGWSKGRLNVSPRCLAASRCNINGCVTWLSVRIAARASRDGAESLLPVILLARAAPAQATAAHCVVDVTDLNSTNTKHSV
jgi:hypothetical protein